MKSYYRMLFLFVPATIFFSCQDKIEDTYKVNEPVYMSYSDLRNSFKTTEGKEIIQPGKIYFKDNYIFVNEYQKGIHVVDNIDPESPQVIKFIEIPGNVDMAIKDNILYADSYVDLVAIDISNINDIREVKRIEGVFQYMIPACEDGIVESVDINQGVIVGWNTTEKTVTVENTGYQYTEYPVWREDMTFMADYANTVGGSKTESNSGTGGSMARFTIYNDYMYTVDNYSLRLFNISTAENPVKENEFYVGWNIETIFPYDEKLFMGSTTGMYIYSLEDPSNPSYISTFWHASSSDPVVLEGNYAYVTLSAGNICADNETQLDVIDISDIQSPVLLKEYPMEEPYGLGIDDNILFVCDGSAGLKVYNASDPLAIADNKLAEYGDINAYDVIPLGDILVMIGTDGLYQYDYTNPENIRELSVIPINYLQHVFE